LGGFLSTFCIHSLGHEGSYFYFYEELECSVETWEKYRVNSFAISLSGSLVFPKERRKIDTHLGYVAHTLAQGRDEPKKTIVPMILAEIMSSLSTCVNGRMFSEGFNILLQLWAIEHFYRQYDRIDLLNGIGNKINNHSRRMEGFTAPVGFVNWQNFFIELSDYHIQWKLYWLATPYAIVRGNEHYFIELIGLKGIQPYAPL